MPGFGNMNQLDMTSLLTITHLEKEDTATINTIADWYHSEWGTPIVKTWERLQTQSAENTIVQIIARMDDVLVGTGGLRAEVNIFQIPVHIGKKVGLTGKEYGQIAVYDSVPDNGRRLPSFLDPGLIGDDNALLPLELGQVQPQ